MTRLFGIGLWTALSLSACVPHSLSAALVKNEDSFPKGTYYVPLPLSSDSPLGEIPAVDLSDDVQATRRITTNPQRCFFVAENQPVNSLSKLRVEYSASQDLKVEMKQVAAAVGADLSNQDTASFVMTNLTTVAGIGVPDLNSACKDFFKAGGDLWVFTRRIVAASAALDFSQNIKAHINGSGTVQTGTKLSGAAGFSFGTNGTITGSNLVIGAQLTKVRVNVKSIDTNLGSTPLVGKRIPFPPDFDGSITIKKYSDSEKVLTVLVSAPLRQQITREGGVTCNVGEDTALPVGKRCEFWLSSGSSLVALQWNVDQDHDGNAVVVLNVTGYSTTFTDNPKVVPPAPAAALSTGGAAARVTARR